MRKNRGKKSSTGKRTGPIAKEVREISETAALLKRKTGGLTKRSTVIHDSAHVVHQGIEGLHHSLDEAHELIHQIEEKEKIDQRPKSGAGARKPFLVVGVGASAGGFESFVQLLEYLPPDTGMAFVFVQHLDPTHESNLAKLLSHVTKIGVSEIRQRTRLVPNHVYVIPPNTSLIVEKGILHLSPRKKGDPHLPIDHFFQSLARDLGNRAVGIVLSGNGHDGTAGLKEIKAGGGITFVQEVATSKFPGMPSSALESGCVDYVLTPAGIARELKAVANHGSLKRVEPVDVLPGEENNLVKIFGLVRLVTGVDFSCYKPTTLRRRITRRMLLRKIDNLSEYVKFLQAKHGRNRFVVP